jgi:hypothetical protein
MVVLPQVQFVNGAQMDFIPYTLSLKTLIFAMLLATIPLFMATI